MLLNIKITEQVTTVHPLARLSLFEDERLLPTSLSDGSLVIFFSFCFEARITGSEKINEPLWLLRLNSYRIVCQTLWIQFLSELSSSSSSLFHAKVSSNRESTKMFVREKNYFLFQAFESYSGIPKLHF